VTLPLNVLQTSLFRRQKKKLKKKTITKLDKAVQKIIKNPETGTLKRGDLSNIRVYKFKAGNQEFLLAYSATPTTIVLTAFGSHENF